MHTSVEILKELVSINSVNPKCQADGAGEAECSRFISELCRKQGIDFQLQEVLPGRHNVVARIEGRNKSKTLLFLAHMDTVSITNMSIPPFQPTIRDGKLYGRGSCDTKGSSAAMMAALFATKENKQREASVVFAATVDEEINFHGVIRFAEDCGKFDGAVVGEPTELDVIVAHKGIVRLRLTVHGRAAHTARPELGINAISKTARLVSIIENELIPRIRAKTHPRLGHGEMTVSLIGGGTQINFVPDQCWIEMDRRSLPGEDEATIVAELQKVFEEIRKKDPEFKATIDPVLLEAPSLDTKPEEPIAQAALAASKAVRPGAKITSAPYATEASYLSRIGIPAVVLGPGSIVQAHTADEWVEIQQVEKASHIYQEIMEKF